MTLIEFTVKGAADDCVILHRRFDRAEMLQPEFGIGMLKDEDVAAGRGRAEIHLHAATRCGAAQELRAVLRREVVERPIVRSVNYDDLVQAFNPPESCESGRNVGGVAPRRDDDADSRRHA